MEQSFISRRESATRALRQKLLDARDYSKAKQLRASILREAAEQRAEVEERIKERHRRECERLEVAKELALQHVKQKAATEVTTIQKGWDGKLSSVDQRHSYNLESYQKHISTREERRPAMHSAYIRDLQRSEKKLALFHFYDEAEQVRRKIQQREHEETEESECKKAERIERAVKHKEERLAEERSFFRAQMKNALHLAKFRAQQDVDRVEAQYDHFRTDMIHSQRCELHMNPLLAAYQRPATMPKPPSSALERGTIMRTRLQGSRLDIPSLCDLYGDKLFGEVPPSTKKLGGAPLSPTPPATVDRVRIV